MIVYFHIDEFARDSIVASSLKKELKLKGHKLIYGNRFTTKFLLPIFYNSFDCIIVPRSSFLINNKKLFNTKVIVLPTESIGRVNSSDEYILYNTFGEKFMMGDLSEHQFVSMYLLWGTRQKSVVERLLPNLSSIVHVVGHPRLDSNCVNTGLKRESKAKIKIGIVSRMTHSNSYDNRTILTHFNIFKKEKYIYYKNDKENLPNSFFNGFQDYIYQELSDFNVYFNLISRLLEHDDVEIYFKVHPRENVLVWNEFFQDKINSGNFKLTNWQTPFVHWCQELDYLISTSSTSFYEAISLGTKVVCIDEIDSLRKYHDLEPSEKTFGLGKFLKLPKDTQEIEKIVLNKYDIEVIDEIGLKNQLFLEIDYPHCFDSSRRIIKLLEENVDAKFRPWNHLYVMFSHLINNLIFIKRILLLSKGSQSNNFLLTFKNISFINKLIEV